MTQSAQLIADGVSKTYQSAKGEPVIALQPTSMTVEAGEFVSIVGPSGCGKSTLLNIFAGFLAPSTGTARIGETAIENPDIDRGVVFQDYALFPWLDVLGNVEFGLARSGVKRRERKETAQYYLDLVGLGAHTGKRISELSGGMKQRVAIARAFATNPSVILMDEPFGALDALTRRHLQRQLLQLWRTHQKTAIFVTHSVQEAIYLSDRIVIMTSHPGTIKRTIEVSLSRPRDDQEQEFRALEREVYAELDEELERSAGFDI